MLIEQTFNQLLQMKWVGFASALEEQLKNRACHDLSFDERVALLVDREFTERQAKKLSRRLQHAKFREAACLEDLDTRYPRGLDKLLLMRLATCQWVEQHEQVLFVGPTGVGKTYLACALGQKACREGYAVFYQRVPRLFHDLDIARADGSLLRLYQRLAKFDLLILDDWGLSHLTDTQRRDMLEILDDRYQRRATIVISQLPIKDWHTMMGEPTVADATLDRLIHGAHVIHLKGESMRKKQAQRSRLTQENDLTK